VFLVFRVMVRIVRNANVGNGTTNFNLVEWTIFPNANASASTPCEFLNNGTSCGIILGNIVTTCESTTINNDLVTISIPYTGTNANAVLQIMVNNQAINNSGDNPSTTDNGNIIFQAYENDSYSITFTDVDCNTININGIIPDNLCANYYDEVEALADGGMRCADLKTELHNLIDNHAVIPYTSGSSFDVLDFMCIYDTDASGGIFNRYSSLQASCNGSGNLPGGFNRDHVMPSSWWGGVTGSDQYTDLFNLYPSESSANSAKNNYSLGEVAGNIVYTSSNGTLVGDDAFSCINS